jgi:molybdopterin synthase catalytic subunit
MDRMLVQVRLFAILRERAGRDRLEVELGDGATVRDALDALGENHGLEELLERMPVAAAVNREYASEDSALREGDELALIPPVSGGATPARVCDEPLSLERLAQMVGRPGAGAIVTFQGTTRDVERLEYEAYREMAEERMAAIVAEAIERHGLESAAAEHRVGDVPLGEASVIVAASAAHREEAFAGAREIIDRIKAEAPIWKKEVEAGASRWVEGRPAGAEEAGRGRD